ncbi:MAG TPA: xylan 1,4-beta-xylosidase, partial [Pseudoxanthomonas sp.]
MPSTSRRALFKAGLAGLATWPLSSRVVAATPCAPAPPAHATGVEGQRKADLGDGTYLNPIVAGDRPDPTILKDG